MRVVVAVAVAVDFANGRHLVDAGLQMAEGFPGGRLRLLLRVGRGQSLLPLAKKSEGCPVLLLQFLCSCFEIYAQSTCLIPNTVHMPWPEQMSKPTTLLLHRQ